MFDARDRSYVKDISDLLANLLFNKDSSARKHDCSLVTTDDLQAGWHYNMDTVNASRAFCCCFGFCTVGDGITYIIARERSTEDSQVPG
jgi:hypothetical protein